MTLFRTTTALCLCAFVTGCSTTGEGGSWWPFSKKDEPVAEVPKIDVKATQAWMDTYEPVLREAVKGSELQLDRKENVLIVTAPVDSSFNPDRPGMLMPRTLGPFTRVAKAVEGDTKTGVLVLGHADTSGAMETNRKLSQERAQAVGAIFRLSGLQRDRLMLKGVGSDSPRAANDSAQGRSLNRRVEIILTPQDTLLALLAQYSQPPVAVTQVAAAAPAEQVK
jgi:outer membrane protein OmpA-like peptidoglycan-associated protein